jgi:hypothetical protein
MIQIKEITVNFGYTANMGNYESCRIDMSETGTIDTTSPSIAREEREAMLKRLQEQVMTEVDKIQEK